MMTDEHKRKISEALKGRKQNPESVAKMALTQKQRYAQNPELRAKTTKQLNDYKYTDAWKSNMSRSRMGHPVSDETKAKMSYAARNRSLETRRKLSLSKIGNQYGKNNKGKKRTSEMKERRAEITAQQIADGKMPTSFTKPQLDLAGFLIDAGYDLIPEVRFGRYCVDLYEPYRHLGFEADGSYWHELVERTKPGYHGNRDSYLQNKFGLPIIRFSDQEIDQMLGTT